MRFCACLLFASTVHAATINIAPGDSYTKMEAAVAGDEVVIAPGTYTFRVNWSNSGDPQNPIIVRAQDPNNRPIWDLTGIPVGTAPGSYTAGDKHRGCWQFRGGHYRVDGIVFRNCIDHASAGIRVVNVPGIEVRRCLFHGNTNGMTGAGEGIVIENSEFDTNGSALPGDAAAHQIYIFGGTLVVRGSYFHDSPAGQNFHIRSRDSTLEYNWFTTPGSYTGDLMSCEFFCGGTGTNPITQKMLLRGNVIIQGNPANRSQLIALFNDEGDSDDGTGSVDNMEVTLVYNTVIGIPNVNNSLVHHLNDSGISTVAHLSNNAVTNFRRLNLIEDDTLANFTVDGNNNWATTASDATSLTGTIFGADPMWSASCVPQTGSPLIGAAMSLGAQDPTSQYSPTATSQPRATALDVGAYESGSAVMPPDLGGADLALSIADLAGVDDLSMPTTMMPTGNDTGGCGCQVGGAGSPSPWWLLLLVIIWRARGGDRPRWSGLR
jgi:MYXO-CTERM domain-containing protein